MEIDYVGVKTRLECDDTLLFEILQAFMEEAPVQRNQLQVALDSGDIGVAERSAHTIKGMSGNIGANRLRSIVVDFENTLKSGDNNAARNHFVLLDENLELVLAEIRLLPAP